MFTEVRAFVTEIEMNKIKTVYFNLEKFENTHDIKSFLTSKK
jgi:hypothetical protein